MTYEAFKKFVLQESEHNKEYLILHSQIKLFEAKLEELRKLCEALDKEKQKSNNNSFSAIKRSGSDISNDAFNPAEVSPVSSRKIPKQESKTSNKYSIMN